MQLSALLLFAAAGPQTIRVDAPLRSGCAASDPVVAKLAAGTSVAIKFALAGEAAPCYLVSATVDGECAPVRMAREFGAHWAFIALPAGTHDVVLIAEA